MIKRIVAATVKAVAADAQAAETANIILRIQD
jgi:hypothetical protein